jgi:UPF0716 protein FxsA
MWFLLGFLVLVLVEIALLIQLGAAIGLWLTLAWIVGTAVLGVILLKGIAMLGGGGMSYRLDEFRDRSDPMAHRALVLIAGLLLILPGPVTDTVGVLLLFAPVRRVALGIIARRFERLSAPLKANIVVDGEWQDISTSRSEDQDSGIRKP